MSSFAVSVDIDEMWRPLTESETRVATAKLAQASRIIRAQFPTIDDRITAGDVDADLVRDIATDMVIRHLRNPDGKRMEAIEDYSFTRDNTQSAGSLWLTAEEIALLTPAARRSAAFTIAPSYVNAGVDPDRLTERWWRS